MIPPELSEVVNWLGGELHLRPLATVEITDLEAAITAAFPQLQGHHLRYDILCAAICDLEARAILRFSRKKTNAYAFYRKDFLPVRLTINRKKPERPVQAPILWHPKLQAASQVKDRRTVQKLQAINNWLINTAGPADEILTAQERSLQIFGADKVLNSFPIKLPDGTRIGEDFLRFRFVEAMIYHSVPIEPGLSSVGLIVENVATCDDFSEWNDRQRYFALVVCGEGKRLVGSPRRLKALAERHGIREWLYFGDIDPEGLNIALEVAQASIDLGGPPVRPYQAAYRWLARYGEVVAQTSKVQDEAKLWEKIREDVINWTESPIVVARGDEVVRKGSLIPQEWLGRSVLGKVDFLEEIARYRPVLPYRGSVAR